VDVRAALLDVPDPGAVGPFRIVAWDLRGHGRSERPRKRDYSIDAFGDDLEAVLEATLADGERAVLAGHSMGGMTIVAWAGRHPDEVERRVAAVALISIGVGDLMLPLEAPDDVTGGLSGLVERHLLSSSSPVTASAGSTGSGPSPSRASRTSA
jgi:pimeloyl-ACP methyl ester carboxylesterase